MAVVAEEGSIGTEPPVDVPARAKRFRETLDDPGDGGLWVLDDAGRVVGWIMAHQPGTTGVFSFGMALLPEARGRGGGRALLDTVLQHARSGGAHKVVLEVWPDNARAIALCARAGFHVEGLRRAHYRRRDGSLRSALLITYLLHEHQ
jgi:ribosomal protein S18 acetylase RimI-like enzyme